MNTAITSGASVVTDSWGDIAWATCSTDAATKTAFDNAFMLAATTGVSVLFSTGDDGDNFADFGLAAPDYPPSSPFVTAVGGTTLEVGQSNAPLGRVRLVHREAGAVRPPMAPPTAAPPRRPTGALAFQAGGGGGTSYSYTQPYYQVGRGPERAGLAQRGACSDRCRSAWCRTSPWTPTPRAAC